MYKPLPESVTIKQSGINGLGLFTKEGIAQGTNLGMSHMKMKDTIFRTPLGGFINHSDTPNCIKTSSLKTTKIVDAEAPNLHTKGPKYVVWNLSTTRDIEAGEELTLKYTFYKI